MVHKEMESMDPWVVLKNEIDSSYKNSTAKSKLSNILIIANIQRLPSLNRQLSYGLPT